MIEIPLGMVSRDFISPHSAPVTQYDRFSPTKVGTSDDRLPITVVPQSGSAICRIQNSDLWKEFEVDRRSQFHPVTINFPI
jgi:hypothetical protein